MNSTGPASRLLDDAPGFVERVQALVCRGKVTEKFWNRPEGTERILQVRATVLSDDDRRSKHLKNRPGSPLRRYRAKVLNQ